MRIVFMGTPEFAVPSLRRMVEEGYDVVAAFTQPDRPAGRGKALTQSPVKQTALELNVPILQYERIRRQAGLDALRALKPDLVVTAAFGQILSKKILEVPKLGTVNVHASLLPAHRGAAPIQWSILNGDSETGVTTMYTDEGIDTGDVIFMERTRIGPEETAGELSHRLAELGADLLIKTVDAIVRGDAPRFPQEGSLATYDKPLDRTDGFVDFSLSADRVHNLVRGMSPWPGAYALLPDGGTLKLWTVRPHTDAPDVLPGTIFVSDAKRGLFIRCGEGAIEVLELQAPGGKRMGAQAYLMGKRIDEGTQLTGRGHANDEA